jgi:hypothetical protein
MIVATQDTSDAFRSHRIGSSIAVIAVLLGFIAATYLMVAVVVDTLSSPSIAAVVLESWAAASVAPIAVDESSASDALHRAPESTDASRECAPSAGIDSACKFN